MSVISRSTAIILGLVILTLMSTLSITPFGLGYATSGSMEPAIPRGGLYVVYDSVSIESGDIIMYESSYRESLVTHRVVNEGTDGYITKGDANPTTDQRGGAPPVPPEDVVGEVLQIWGYTPVIPGVGVWADLVSQYRVFVFAFIWGLLLTNILRSSGRTKERVVRIGDVVTPVFVVALVTTVTVMLLVSGSTTINFYASDTVDKDSPLLINPTEPTTTTVPLTVKSFEGFTYRILTVDGAVLESTAPGETSQELLTTVTVPAVDRTGTVTVDVSVYHYPKLLPRTVVFWLHLLHPGVAASAIALMAFLPAYLLYWLLIDPQKPIYSKGESLSLPSDLRNR